eukprot:gb/GEZN01013351.1/.p1 GENE.gb/GEZN01013351.1/~~gb/GEZN01013351.1/.p1  ORF type:complete len:259 (-),score=42.80 gb/GEZN01013351.1/:137-913(-)
MGDQKKETGCDVKSCHVVKTEVEDGVVFFLINVESATESWSVKKRYSQFEELQHTVMSGSLSRKVPAGCELPPKKLKLFTKHTSPTFIEERRVLLENYLKTLLKVKEIAQSPVFTRFLTTDKQENKVVEKKTQKMPDDVEITHVHVPSTRTMSDHVLYQVDVSNARKPQNFSKWTVLKRFTQFADMDALVRASFEGTPAVLEQLPPPPRKEVKILSDHMDDVFIQHRRVLLENYLQKMLIVEEVVRNKDFLAFLGVNL